VDTLLKRHPEADVRVFAVWLPILPTDVSPPISFVLRRLPDRRVQQYWDPQHLITTQLRADARPPQPEQDCCMWRKKTLWDLVAVYPKTVTWADRIPAATLFNGPVVDVTGPLETAILSPGK
jgi:hypothetical protein